MLEFTKKIEQFFNLKFNNYGKLVEEQNELMLQIGN